MNNKIMVVDDEQEVRMLLCTMLKRANYETIDIADGATLKTALGGPQPDVVLLD